MVTGALAGSRGLKAPRERRQAAPGPATGPDPGAPLGIRATPVPGGRRRHAPRQPAHPLQPLRCRGRTPTSRGSPVSAGQERHCGGTGDSSHPARRQELDETLVPSRACSYLASRPSRVAARHARPAAQGRSASCRPPGYTREFDRLRHAPAFGTADRITPTLAKVCNLASGGRPIPGLDSRHLLEITLEDRTGCYLLPAHACTPWFAVLDVKIRLRCRCRPLRRSRPRIFARSTGLSSDLPVNWTCTELHTCLASNSDAHSPPTPGREPITFATGRLLLDDPRSAAGHSRSGQLAGRLSLPTGLRAIVRPERPDLQIWSSRRR
jgi:hypothetical protein